MSYLSDKLAAYLFSQTEDAQVSIEVYKYSTQVTLEMLSGILASICIAVFLNMELECLIFLILFSVLRSYAGGVHLDKFRHCFLFSTMITVIVLMSVKYCYVPVRISGLMMGASIMVLWKVPASANKNRVVTETEAVYFRKKLMQAVLAVVIFFLVMLVCKAYKYVFLAALTITVTTVLMLVGKWKEEYKNRG